MMTVGMRVCKAPNLTVKKVAMRFDALKACFWAIRKSASSLCPTFIQATSRSTMRADTNLTTSLWFASLVALLVALGTQHLLGILIPVSAISWLSGTYPNTNYIFVSGITNFWPLATLIRLLSFTVGGAVGALLTRDASLRVSFIFAIVSLVSAHFEDVAAPDIASIFKLYIWVFAGPVGVCFGIVLSLIHI